ncbi:MAG: glycosyltransferase family 2 protein [Candidatus Omnitrophica bacterium]|nr:glycosyltransferase family 2 protein [Candidatus Omnitrophota bacterium]
MFNKNPSVSIVFPIFNEEETIKLLYQLVRDVCTKSNVDYEMIFVDDGSTDNSLNVVKDLKNQDKKVAFVSLSRNFGHQSALFAGMSYATGDAVITMDADLQHSPSLIPKMIDLWRNGYEVVYTMKKKYDLPFIMSLVIKLFYWFISKISDIRLSFGQSDFRLLDRKVLDAILEIPEYHKFLRGQIEWVGFRQYGLMYDVEKRHSGKSKISYRKRLSFALDGIFAFSSYPLHLLMSFSIGVAILSFLYICIELTGWMLKALNICPNLIIPHGWVTLIVSVFFLGSLQLMAIALVGGYIGRTYDQTKGRPVFIIKESSVQKKTQAGAR